MIIRDRLRLYWQHYTPLEKAFVVIPFFLLTPRLIPLIEPLHNGETSQEFIFILAILVLLIGSSLNNKNLSKYSFQGTKEIKWLFNFALCFTGWSTLSLFWTTDIGGTIDHSVLWGAYTSLLFIGWLVLRKRSAIGLCTNIIITISLLAAFRLAQKFYITDQPAYSPIFSNIGVETELLLTVIPLLFYVLLFSRRRIIVGFILCSIVCCWSASLSTYQRTPLIGNIITILIWVIAIIGRFIVPKGKLRLISLACILLLITFTQLKMQSGNKNDKDQSMTGASMVATKFNNIKTINEDSAGRLIAWAAAIEMLKAKPLTGMGAGAYKANYTDYKITANQWSYWRNINATMQTEGGGCLYRAHNEYVEILGELGVPGGILIVGIFVSILGIIWRIGKKNIPFAVMLLTSVIAFAFSSSLTSFSFRWLPSAITFLLMVIISFPYISKRKYQSLESYTKFIKRNSFALTTTFLFIFMCGAASRITLVLASNYYQYLATVVIDANSKTLYLEKSLHIDRYNFSSAYWLGKEYYDRGLNNEATVHLNQALKQGVNDIGTYSLLAFAYEQSEQQEKAIVTLQQASDAYPTSVYLHALLMNRYEQAGNYSQVAIQQAALDRIGHPSTKVWEALIKSGLAASMEIARRENLPHPSKISPPDGVDLILRRQRLAANAPIH